MLLPNSTLLKEVSHKDDTLTVVFNNDTTWEYDNVSKEEYSLLISATSVGSYFLKHIKHNKIGRKV